MGSNAFYGSLMFLAGIGIPTMAALNGGLGTRLQSPVLAAVILFCLALAITLTAWVTIDGASVSPSRPAIPWFFYTGGAFVVFYVLGITWVAPRFGVANSVSFVLLGQLVAIAVIDHVGFAGAPQTPISVSRLVGLALMAAGVVLVIKPHID